MAHTNIHSTDPTAHRDWGWYDDDTTDNDTDPNDLPPDPSPTMVLGIRKCHLPERFKHLFLNDDLILFKHRRLPDAVKNANKEWELPSLRCSECFQDQMCAWAALVFFGALSIPLALSIFSSPISIIIPAFIGLVATVFVQCAAQSKGVVIPRLLDPLIDVIIDVSGWEKLCDIKDNFTWKLDNFRDVWDIWNEAEFDNKTTKNQDGGRLLDAVLSEWSEDMYFDGMLVLRLSKCPKPCTIMIVPWIPWFGRWANKVYQIYRCHQRSFAASFAYDMLEKDGSHADGTEYTIEELERDRDAIFLGAWPDCICRGAEDDTEEDL